MGTDRDALRELKALLAASPEAQPAETAGADEESGQSYEETKRNIEEIMKRALAKLSGPRR